MSAPMNEGATSEDALPLAGLVVLDISSFIAAPAAAVTLADFGADVIKIEPPGEGDPHRHNYKNASYPQSDKNFPWQLDGRLKRSIALDLKNASARAVLERLIARADIMIVNFPPPARERLKLRWEDIEPLNPRLVYCSLTGYGETGPDRDRPGFDITAYFGRSGILDAARYEGGPPGLSLPAQGDRATAMTLVAAILLGLRQRDRTGKGSWVGTSLYANGVWANGTSAAGALIGAKLPTRQPPDRPRNALTNLYRTKDDRWLQLLVVRDDRLWETFCTAIGQPDLAADPRFTERAERRARALELGQALAADLRGKDLRGVGRRLFRHRHSLRRRRPPGRRGRRRAGPARRHLRRHHKPRGAAHREQSHPAGLRQAPHVRAATRRRPAQRGDPARTRLQRCRNRGVAQSRSARIAAASRDATVGSRTDVPGIGKRCQDAIYRPHCMRYAPAGLGANG